MADGFREGLNPSCASADFARRPTGKSLARFRDPRVQPLCEKYFRFRLTQIRCISKPVPCPQEGRFAVVTDVGHGMRWTRGRQARSAIAGRDEPRERSAACK